MSSQLDYREAALTRLVFLSLRVIAVLSATMISGCSSLQAEERLVPREVVLYVQEGAWEIRYEMTADLIPDEVPIISYDNGERIEGVVFSASKSEGLVLDGPIELFGENVVMRIPRRIKETQSGWAIEMPSTHVNRIIYRSYRQRPLPVMIPIDLLSNRRKKHYSIPGEVHSI